MAHKLLSMIPFFLALSLLIVPVSTTFTCSAAVGCEQEKVITGQTTVSIVNGATSGTSATFTYPSAFDSNPNYQFWFPAGTNLPSATLVSNYVLAQPTQVPCNGFGCNSTRFLSNFTQLIPAANQCSGCLTEWMNDSSNEFGFDSTGIGQIAIDYLYIPPANGGSCDCQIQLQAQTGVGTWITCTTSGIDFALATVQLVKGPIGSNGCLNLIGLYRIVIRYDMTPLGPTTTWGSGRITLRAYTTAINTPTPIPVCGSFPNPNCKTGLKVKITLIIPSSGTTTVTINFKAYVCLNGSMSC